LDEPAHIGAWEGFVMKRCDFLGLSIGAAAVDLSPRVRAQIAVYDIVWQAAQS
jgi:hypothetical protein